MATVSTIVSDDDIKVFIDSIEKWKVLKQETQLQIDAGLTPSYTPQDIDKKIAATLKIIETFTGKPYRP